jgi:hypothetical protein
MSEKTRYPLCWPDGWKRTPRERRTRAAFGRVGISGHGKERLSIGGAIERVVYELGRLGVDQGDTIVSTNLKLNVYGIPRGDQGEPADPGVAVYWHKGATNKAMAVDRYDRVADNIGAIAATLEAMRAIERHGGAEILERVFFGFAQLPERAGGKAWRDVLGFPATAQPSKDAIGSRFRELSKDRHPDKPGGTRELFDELVWARDAALWDLSAGGQQ